MDQSLRTQLGTRCGPLLEHPRMSRQAATKAFPYCAKIQLPTTGEPLDNRARGPYLMRSPVPERGSRLASQRTQQVGAFCVLASGRASVQLTGLHGPHPANTADRDRLPVLTPHAPSRKPKAIYRGPERGTNPPDLFRAPGGRSSSTPSRPIVADDSASEPQVGGPASDRPSAGQCPLVKARSTASPPQYRVGRFYGVGVLSLQIASRL